jgi:putative membrane protein
LELLKKFQFIKHIIMKKILIPSLLAFIVFATSCNNDGNKTDSKEVAKEQNEVKEDSTKVDNDADFAVAAADGGMMEVKLGQLAQTNGASAKVKELGKMMETDHSKANEELKGWAAKYNVTLPTALSQDKQSKYDEFAAKKGADFDKAYAADMVDDHEKDIKEFQKEADGGKNAELKAWAGGKVPVLQHHLEMAKSTNDAVKK